jgi:hypothetical protein
LGQGDAEEVNRYDVSLLVLWRSVLNHSDRWSRVSS